MEYVLTEFLGKTVKGLPDRVTKGIKGVKMFFFLYDRDDNPFDLTKKEVKLQIINLKDDTLQYEKVIDIENASEGKCFLITEEDMFKTEGLYKGFLKITNEEEQDYVNIFELGLMGVK